MHWEKRPRPAEHMNINWRELTAEEDGMNTAEVEDLVESWLEPTITPFERLRRDADLKSEEQRELRASMEHELAVMRVIRKALVEEYLTC